MTILWYYFTSAASLVALFSYQREKNTDRRGHFGRLLGGKSGGMSLTTRASLFVMAVLPLACLAAFRSYSVGTDTGTVYYPYYYARYCVWKEAYRGTEVGFYCLIKLGYWLFGSFSGVLLTVAAFLTAVLFLGISEGSENVKVVLQTAAFYLAFAYFDSFNIMRQACATSVVVFGLRFLKEEKPLVFALSVLFAAFFHNSALIAFAVLLFYGVRKHKIYFFSALCAVAVLPFLLPFVFALFRFLGWFSKYLDRYSGGTVTFSAANFSLLVYHIPFFATILFFGKKLFRKGGFDRVLLLMTAFEAACFSMKMRMVWLARLSGYFMIAEGVLVGKCEAFCSNKKLYRALVLAYEIGYFALVYGVFKNGEIVPYKFSF